MDSNILILLIISISAIVLAVSACIIAIFAVLYSIRAHATVMAMEKSTHTVQYMPIDPKVDKENSEWITRQETLEKERKMYSEDIESEMPEFAQDDEDKHVYSF
jgi:uncharacterized protein YoxC